MNARLHCIDIVFECVQVSGYSFSLMPSNAQFGDSLIPLLNKNKVKKVAVFYTQLDPFTV